MEVPYLDLLNKVTGREICDKSDVDTRASPGRVCRAALSPHSGEPDRQRSLLPDLAEDVRLAEMTNVMGHLKKIYIYRDFHNNCLLKISF